MNRSARRVKRESNLGSYIVIPSTRNGCSAKIGVRDLELLVVKFSGRRTVGCTGVGTKTSEKRLPDRYAVCTSDDIEEAVPIPDVNKIVERVQKSVFQKVVVERVVLEGEKLNCWLVQKN